MFKKFICLILFVCLCAWVSNSQAQLMVDFGTATSPVQSGYAAYTASNEVLNTFTSQTFDAFGTTVTITPTWAPDAVVACMQMFDRGEENYEDATENLMRDWIGTDTRSVGDPLTLTISGLPAGVYSWLSFHTDTEHTAAVGTFDVTVNDAAGSVTTKDIVETNNSTTTYDGVTKFETTIVSDGSDITLVFDLHQYAGGYNDAWFYMNGFELEQISGASLAMASNPYPKNNASNVLTNIGILSWKPGQYVEEQNGTHNVFLGTDVNSVTDATLSDAEQLGVTLFEGLDSNNVKISRLEYGATYYWRVDEVNKPASTGVVKGKIWSFSTESEGVELAVKNVVDVEAFAPQGAVYEDQEPNTTYNGIGVDAAGMHSNDAATMWAGVGDYPGDVWLQYELDQIYKLFQLKIWNYNEIEPGTPFGPKDVNITYSIDNVTWKALDEIQVFPKASGESTYEADIFVDMNGAIAKYVRLTFLSSYTDDLYTGGISEIRFLVIPTRATVPSPEDKAVNVDLDSIISWKAGRNVGVHKVYISYDKASVDNRDIGVMSETIDPNYPIALGLGKTYYWRVDEVNDAEEYTTWDGPVWQFSTQQYVVVDNFDSGYGNDTATNAVFLTWKDAGELGNTSVNGSWMGRKSEPYLQTINHSSRYSAPMEYDNALVSYSEVKAETSMLDIGSDWSKGNPNSMEIWFRADANDVNEPVTDKLYASLSGGSRIYFDGDPSAIRKTIWTKFEVPLTGVNLTNVTSVTIGVEKIGSTGGKGVIYLDDIRLGVSATPVYPGTDNLIARYEMENNVNDTSASGFNGTAFGIENGGLTYEAGKYGNALVFDGNNDYVELPIGETISTLTSCTISTWVNYGGGAIWQKVYDFGSDTNKYMDLSANNNANGIRCSITTGSWQSEDGCNSPSVLSIGSWEHIVVVIDKENATLKLYRNGDLSASDDSVTIFPENLGVTTSNWLGRSVYSDNPYFKGKIDDFRIYNRALSAGEVKYLYKN